VGGQVPVPVAEQGDGCRHEEGAEAAHCGGRRGQLTGSLETLIGSLELTGAKVSTA
jgi:hypothetical protein